MVAVVFFGVSFSTHLWTKTATEDEEFTLSSQETAEPGTTYQIMYFRDVDTVGAPNYTMTATAGVHTPIALIEDLGFTKEGYVFEGWRLYRDADDSWYLRNPKGGGVWVHLQDGTLPEGYHYALRTDGMDLIAPTQEGAVRLYAQWGGVSFMVAYHKDDKSPALELRQYVTYGEDNHMLSLEELGIKTGHKTFKGWKLYRELDNRWRMKDSEGKGSWERLEHGAPPAGFEFSLFPDQSILKTATTSGVVHAYAQWG